MLTALVAALAGLVMAVFALRSRHRRSWIWLTLCSAVCLTPVICVALAIHPEWIDARFRTYQAFHLDLRAGMTRQEVLAAMERRYPAAGPRMQPIITINTPERLGFFMNPETSPDPDCEGIFLTLKDESVTKIEYLAD